MSQDNRKSKLITSLNELKEACKEDEVVDFAITLNGGAFSRKQIFYHHPVFTEDQEYAGKFEVTNCIDDTTQLLTEEEIMDPFSDVTNIGKAISYKAFYQILE